MLSMAEPVFYTLIAVLAVSLISFTGLLILPARIARVRWLLLAFVGLAAGALLGDAFIHLIPEAFEKLGESTALWILAGMGAFFIFEKFLHWHHHHTIHEASADNCDDCHEHIAPFGRLIILSDAFHNIIDGAIIAAGFMASTEVGIATTVAVALHEIPQEIGDFGALLHAGFSRTRALFVNFISALTAFLGALLVFALGAAVEGVVPVLSAITAGSFIYIAASDLVPELHKAPRTKESIAQFLAIVLGVAAMVILTRLE